MRVNSTRFTSVFFPVQGKYSRQNEEPPKDTGEGGEKGIPSPFPAPSLLTSTRRRRAAQFPPSPLLNPPTEGCQGWPRGGRNPSGRAGSPPPPGLVFPSCGGWARGWGARRVGARSAEPRSRRDSGGTELSPEVTRAEVSGGQQAAKAKTRRPRWAPSHPLEEG